MARQYGNGRIKSVVLRNLPIIFILAISLVIRVVFSLGNNKALFIDIEVYEREAVAILDKGADSLEAYHAPVYPFFIAAVYAVLGRSLLYVYLVQCILGTATTLLVYMIATELGASRRTCLLAAGASLFYWPLQLYPGILLSETVFIFLLLLGVCIFLKALALQRLVLFIAAGAIFALSTLTRSINMLLVFILPVFYLIYARKNFKRIAKNSAVFMISFAAVITPWAIRNYIKYEEFIPVDTLGGINLYIGNNERASGFFVSLSEKDLEEAVQKYTGKGRRGEPVEVNDKNLKEAALTYIKMHPFRFARLTLWRASLFVILDFRDVDWVLLRYMSKHFLFHHVFWKTIIYFSDILFFLLAAAGVPLLLKGRRELLLLGFILYYLGITSVFYISERYRLPIMPFMAVAAGYAADRILSRIKGVIAARAR